MGKAVFKLASTTEKVVGSPVKIASKKFLLEKPRIESAANLSVTPGGLNALLSIKST